MCESDTDFVLQNDLSLMIKFNLFSNKIQLFFFYENKKANPPAKKISWLFNGRLLGDNLFKHAHQTFKHQNEHQNHELKDKNQTKHNSIKKQTKHKNHQTELQTKNQLIHSNRTQKLSQRTKQSVRLRRAKELINVEQFIERITFRNDDHSLMSVKTANRFYNGKYECLTSNSIGSTYSEPVILDIKCKLILL